MSMPSDAEIDRILAAKVAARLASSPKSMAWILARYKEIEDVDDASIARQLGVDEHQLHHLAMFGRPRPYLFTEDIETIAEHFDIDQLVLASLVRRVESLETFRAYQNFEATGLLAAARDHAAEEPGEYDAEPDNSDSTSPAEPDDEQ
jgi:hypothetical protein